MVKRLKNKIILLAVLLIVSIGSYFGWLALHKKETVSVLATDVVSRGPVRQVLEQTGIVKTQVGAIVKIGTRATGTIEKMLVQVGDRVSRGQLVARIDNREIRAQVAEARAGLRTDEAELQRVRRIEPLNIEEAQAELALTRAQAEYLRSNYQRIRQLAAEGIVSQDELENAQQQAEVETRREAARQTALERLQQEYEENLRQAQLAVQSSRAKLDALQVRLSYTDIHSPIDGIVSQVTAQEGETIVAGLQVANLITVLDTSRLEMWIYVDETDIGQVSPGQQVEFRVDAYTDKVFPGTIQTVYPEPEIRDNIVYYKALVAIPKPEAAWLRPEMTTQVQIVVAEKDAVLRLPNAALKWVDGRQVVFLLPPDGKVREVHPELGLTGLLESEILQGLQEGDRVATQVVLAANGKKRKNKP
ncbi:efflux pump, RND family, membrane fusion protein [Syntrophotalea carbinolica DSM 2380]|uniref:Efflux pump, RND family, membrane fusion protein n=1 Tax=Syntrophotalea carbinolica (strain DSM 2380 / NBRC 103641 / GraBd1) TaxID=338963 RepID=Q3A7W3_SYNC1|nr:efflux RND transporter periplasmic adaptor subunit [Syntrophotalea carbinolica]ABA87531.1 efflux pump, RND family, membrane fusion protein [Syntrophotalea carbinolica DSM 2380]